jgi:acyl carrier protein
MEIDKLESMLLEIFEEVLGIKDLSPDAVFLEVGGDSLAAVLCISRIREVLGVELVLEDFFTDESTAANFSRRISTCKPF